MTCPYWSREGKIGPGQCDIGMFGGKPYVGNCATCQKQGTDNPQSAAAFLADVERTHPSGAPVLTDCCGNALNYPR